MTICTEDDTQAEEREIPRESPSRMPDDKARELLKLSNAAVIKILHHEDEDLAGEVMRSAIKAWPTYDPSKSGFATWVYMIANRRIQDGQRSDGRRIKVVSTNDEQVGHRVGQIYAQIEESHRRGGWPGITDQQKFAILKLHREHNLTVRGMWRFLNASKEARKALGFKRCPSRDVIHRAIQWAREQ